MKATSNQSSKEQYRRCLLSRELEKEGYYVPKRFLCKYISFKIVSEAAEIVLLYSNNYAHPTIEGVRSYLSQYNLNVDRDIIVGLDRNLNSIFRRYNGAYGVVQEIFITNEID